MENDKYVYFSEYKREEQCRILQKLGFKEARFTFKEGYLPNSVRKIDRSDYDYSHHYNSLGFRGKLPKIQKAKDEYRIIILGDSFIEGDGTPDDSTISVLLETALNKIGSSYTYKVINAGISGSNPIYEQSIYLKFLKQYHPNLIINSFFSNDIGDVYIMMQNGKIPTNEYFFATSHIFRFISFGVLGYNNFHESNVPNSTKNKRNKIITHISSANCVFKKRITQQSISLINMYIPSKEEIKVRKSKNELATSIYYDINLLNEFIKIQTKEPNFIKNHYWNTDAHFKPKGYNLVADILAKKIIEKNVRAY